jgi:tRNA(fMet)-specific endonuclease VapC
MRLALDTNRYRDFSEGLASVVEALETAEEVLVPFVVVAELRAGFAVGRQGLENERLLRRFLERPGISVVYATDATTRAYAQLYRQLRVQGTPIPTNDLWIAALALQHDLVLFTRDTHFDCIPRLARI